MVPELKPKAELTSCREPEAAPSLPLNVQARAAGIPCSFLSLCTRDTSYLSQVQQQWILASGHFCLRLAGKKTADVRLPLRVMGSLGLCFNTS